MPTLTKVTLKLKNNNLAYAMTMLSQKSRKLPRVIVNRAMYSIAIKAEKTMPVVTPARIQAEMEQSKFISSKRSTTQRRQTLAMGIILASMHPNSKFNIRTGGVFARAKPVFSGTIPIRRLKFWEWVSARAVRMTAVRKSSSGFFKVCASVVKFIFKDAARDKVVSGPPSGLVQDIEAVAGPGNVSKNIGRLAGGIVARGDGMAARASFWVTATEPDTKGTPGGALQRIAGAVWQRAVDSEAAGIRAHAEGLYVQTMRDSGLVVK